MTLTLESIRHKVPAIFADNPSPKVSSKYTFVRTADVLDIMLQQGWDIIHAKQQKTRSAANIDTTKHTVLLRQHGIDTNTRKRLPTIRLINSHDWSSRFQVLFGMLELVCSNGLFFAGPSFEAYDVRHDNIHEDMSTVLARFNSAATRMDDIARNWGSLDMHDEQIIQFMRGAARIRFGEDHPHLDEAAFGLNRPRYAEQTTNDLWTVFNRAQGNIMEGGFRVNNRRSRRITNIQKEKDMNERLFLLASDTALSLN